MTLTVRHLQDTDALDPPRWRMGKLRPDNETTLVAVDESGKIRGICWMAYGGTVAMIGIWFHAEPKAALLLAPAAEKFAKSRGCAMLLTHVIEHSKLLRVLRKKGWMVNTAFNSVAVGKRLE